jgi:hypothetical protein
MQDHKLGPKQNEKMTSDNNYNNLVSMVIVVLLHHRWNFTERIHSLKRAADAEKIQTGRKMLEALLEGADDIDLSELHIPLRTLRANNVSSGCYGPYGSKGIYGCPSHMVHTAP